MHVVYYTTLIGYQQYVTETLLIVCATERQALATWKFTVYFSGGRSIHETRLDRSIYYCLG